MQSQNHTGQTETEFTKYRELTISIEEHSAPLLSTILQSGIMVEAPEGISIGAFLEILPGFTEQYINDKIQTIFLNGTATDDLETPLCGEKPVLALSAAMPGLAGAIFRKNSLHAALRTASSTAQKSDVSDNCTIILKLFNTIAKERGPGLLQSGVTLKAKDLFTFLKDRPKLLAEATALLLEREQLQPAELISALDQSDLVHLSLVY